MSKTLGQLAEHVAGKVLGDPAIEINSAATLGKARKGDISFLSNRKYEKQLHTTTASAVIVGKLIGNASLPLLIAKDPYYAFMQIVVLLHGHREHQPVGISPKAFIADSAKIGTNCDIHNFVTISENTKIGSGSVLYPGVFIVLGTKIGKNCILFANVCVYDGCKLGNRVIINANSTIGEDGFGYATHKGEHHKIPQIGSVVIEDDVEVGSSCAIERGTLNDTIIGQGTKMGDLVAIGHGAKIGVNSLLVAQVGIAGSAILGHHCTVGGQVGVVGHITIGNNVTIAAQSGVSNSIPDGSVVLGSPAIEISKGRRALISIQHLPEIRKSVRQFEKRLAKLEKKAEQ